MKINNSFFNPNRLVFQNKAPEPKPSAAGQGEYLDLYDRTDLLDEMEGTLKGMKKVDKKLRAELDKAQELNTEGDEKEASDAAQKLYAKLNKIGPDEAEVRKEIAKVRGKEGKTKRSVRHFRKAPDRPKISDVGPKPLPTLEEIQRQQQKDQEEMDRELFVDRG